MYTVFFLRALLALTLGHFAYRKIAGKGQSSGSNSPRYGWVELVIALFMLIGLFTKVALVLNAAILVIKLILKARDGKLLSDGVNYYILLLAIALALIFLGPGAFTLDSVL